MLRPAIVLLCSGAALLVGASAPQQGYLAPGEFSVMDTLEPAPHSGDPRDLADRAIFRATRPMLATARGALATRDVDYSAPALMRDFSCAVGVTLTPANAPRLLAVAGRAGIDTGAQTSAAKNYYQRLRPYLVDPGAICQPRSELAGSYDYPSGHTTLGWTWALILANLAPDRARQILLRGRAYGDSRFICGAHNESAVEAGFQSATATLAVVATKPAYQTDLEAARGELASLRTSGQTPPSGCSDETLLLKEATMPGQKDAHSSTN